MAQRKNETKSEYYKRKYIEYEKPRRERVRDKFNAQRRDHYQRFKYKIRPRNKTWRDINNEDQNSKQRVRNKTGKYRTYRRKLHKRKYDTDIQFKLMSCMRSRISALFKGTSKSSSTIKLLGCDSGFLRNYLEARFEQWMNWSNYGEWQIDHIIPCVEFDLTKPEQQKMCFHYTNLRPLRAKLNSDWRKARSKVHQPEFL